MLHLEWKTLVREGIADAIMECLKETPVPSPPEEQPEEVYSVQWNVASDMYWQVHDRSSTLFKYLTEFGPRELPSFKKELKMLKKKLKRLGNGGDPFSSTTALTKEKHSSLKNLITEVANQVSVATVSLNQPGLRKFFTEGIGKHVLRELQVEHSCSIEMLCEEVQVVSGREVQSSLTTELADFDEILNELNEQVSVRPGGRGYFQKTWVGVCGPLLKTLTLFMSGLQANLRPKSAIFPTLFMSY